VTIAVAMAVALVATRLKTIIHNRCKMPQIPDLINDPRYRNEVGWFLHREKYGPRDTFDSYVAERVAWSRLLLNEVLGYAERDVTWLTDKTVVSIGCGCTGELVAFPAAVKIGIDPLLYAYQKLGLLLVDEAGSRTVYLSQSAESLPLLDDFADLIICRNALDHMPKPEMALEEFRRILKGDGVLFASVDIGGEPTPDEPTVFSVESLHILLEQHFEVVTLSDGHGPHDSFRVCSTKVVARKKARLSEEGLDRELVLRAYENSSEGWSICQRLMKETGCSYQEAMTRILDRNERRLR
jgi:SAM-dependent methyltransferase